MLYKNGVKNLLTLIAKTPDSSLYVIMEENGYDMHMVIRAFCEIQNKEEAELLKENIDSSMVELGLNPKYSH